jgi:transposase
VLKKQFFMQNKFKTIIGIDISKNTFDATKMFYTNVNVTMHQEFLQTKKGFEEFKTAKQLASYRGVVPFDRKSGISVQYKHKISPFSNIILKRLLHLCPTNTIPKFRD